MTPMKRYKTMKISIHTNERTISKKGYGGWALPVAGAIAAGLNL